MKTLTQFLAEINMKDIDIAGHPPLVGKQASWGTYYTYPITDTHSIVVKFTPPEHPSDADRMVKVGWQLHGDEPFPSSKYRTGIHRRVMSAVAKAIDQHTQDNPNVRVIKGDARSPALDRVYSKILQDYVARTPGSKYHKTRLGLFGVHQHMLVLPENISK